MTKQTIKRQSILPRISGIEGNLAKLRKFSKEGSRVFDDDIKFAAAQTYLRQALEGVFNIGSHILSRLPGGRATEYAQIAKKLGELTVVDKNFAEQKLVKMAGYRNRLTHAYSEITQNEMYDIARNHLRDIEEFLSYIKTLLEHPEKFDLVVE